MPPLGGQWFTTALSGPPFYRPPALPEVSDSSPPLKRIVPRRMAVPRLTVNKWRDEKAISGYFEVDCRLAARSLGGTEIYPWTATG